MIEYNGWAIISESYNEQGENSKMLDSIIERIQQKINDTKFENEIFSLNALNGTYHLTITANHNHRKEHIIDFFKWIAEISVGSYGLLYVQDDEDIERGNENIFKVWCMKKGNITESNDNFLSPRINQVED